MGDQSSGVFIHSITMPGNLTIQNISTRESCGMRHYSSADAMRLGQSHIHLLQHQNNKKNSGGAGFQAARGLKNASPFYKTTSNQMNKKIAHMLSATMNNRPEWKTNCNPKSNAFSNGFNNMMHSDTSLGSMEARMMRKKKDELKKIQKHQNRALLYEELVKRQQEKLERKKERKRKRLEKYQLMVRTVVVIQCLARMWLSHRKINRIKLKMRSDASCVIQMYGRRYVIRKRCETRRRNAIETSATLKIQFGWQQRIQRVEAKEELNRRKANRSRAKRRLLREMNKERRSIAARMIQSMVRGWKGRKLIKILEMERRRRKGRKKKKEDKKSIPSGKNNKKSNRSKPGQLSERRITINR